MLVEKPLALSLADCDALVAASTKANGLAMTGFHMRWHRLLVRAREVIASGVLGHLESIRATWNSPRGDDIAPPWKRTRVNGGGAIVELGVHLFDQWRFLTGAEVIDVFARARHGTRDDESATISASLSNGMLAEAIVSERTSHDIEIEVSGDQGRLRISCQRFDGLELYLARKQPGMLAPRMRGICARVPRIAARAGAHAKHSATTAIRIAGEWQHLIDCVRDGGMPGCSMLDGRAAVRVALAAAASASSGEAVRVDEAPPCLSAAR